MATSKNPPEAWSNYAEEYARITAPRSLVISTMLSLAESLRPFSTATGILDDGCGSGTVSAVIIEDWGSTIPPTARLVASDYSSGMVAYVEKLKASPEKSDDAVWQRLETMVLDATDLSPGIPSGSLSHVLSNLVFMSILEPSKPLEAAYRALEDSGVLAFTAFAEMPWHTSWVYAKEVAPNNDWDVNPHEVWKSVAAIEKALKVAGFSTIEVKELEIPSKVTPDSLHKFIRGLIGSANPSALRTFGGLSDKELDRAADLIVQGTVKTHGVQGTEEMVLMGRVIVAGAKK